MPARRIHRAIAATLSVTLLASAACATPRPVPVAPGPDEVVACRAYRRSLAETPPANRPGPALGMILSSLAMGAGVAYLATKSEDCPPSREGCGSAALQAGTAHLLGGTLLAGGVGMMIGSVVAYSEQRDPRLDRADRCDEQLARLCPDFGDAACAAAVAKACAAGDAGACWAQDPSRPMPAPAPPTRVERCAVDPATGRLDPDCAVGRALQRVAPAREPPVTPPGAR